MAMAKGGKESKVPGYGRLLVSPFPIKLPITRHFWLPTPLCHTYSEHEDSPGPPVAGAKMHPEMP